jgi:hypothetical protein
LVVVVVVVVYPKATGDHTEKSSEEPACSEPIENPSTLVQIGKTEKIWDFKKADTKFIGPADNSLPHEVDTAAKPLIRAVDAAVYQSITKQNKWLALYF